MKLSLAASAVIALLFLLFGFKNHTRLSTLTDTHAQLTAEAAGLGLSTDPTPEAPPTRSRRERIDREAVAKSTAADLIAFAKEMEALEKSGGKPEDPEKFQQRVLDFMERMAALDSAQLKILIAEFRASPDLAGPMRQGLIGFSIMNLANDHPRSAIELFTETSDLFPDRNMGKHLFSSALGRWAKNDPSAAVDWVRANGEKFPDLITGDTKQSLITGAAANDPKLAFQLITDLNLPSGNPYSAIIQAAKTPAERTTTLHALREHLPGITDEEKRRAAINESFSTLGTQLAAEGFSSATGWIATSNLTPAETEALANGLTHNLKSADTGQWIEWIDQSLPPEKSRDNIRNIVRSWTTNDYAAAGQWLNTAPEGPAKTAAVRTYAETVAPYEPETAAQWALTLPPGKDRTTTLQTIHQNWPESDPAGSAAFAEAHGIK